MTRWTWWWHRLRYRLADLRLEGRPEDTVWYFAFGSNMNEAVFRERRGMAPIEWRVGRVPGWRLRFNLEGRPRGRAAPANLSPDARAEVWGVLYKITRAAMLRLDRSEGVPGRRYFHQWLEAETVAGERLPAFTYVAQGKEDDGNPFLRYITRIREGARRHGLPAHYVAFLDEVKPAE